MRDSAFKLGLAGRDILASRSPWMHEEEGRAQNMNLSYTLFDFNARGWADGDLPRLLERLSGEGFDGINVTFPFKQAAIAYLDDLSDDARKVGAVNTIAFRNGKFSGYNTDLTGFAQSVREGLGEIEGDRAVQIGAGGAGAATAHALLALGLGHLTIFDNDETRRQALCTNLGKLYGDRVRAGEDIVVATREAAGIINATPVGMAKYPGLPVPAACISAHHWIADVVYFPLETGFLREARARGCSKILEGAGMAVHQAAAAFEIFTGRQADTARMNASFARFEAL